MSTWSEAEVEGLAGDILTRLRAKAQEAVPERAAIDPRRCPGWLEAARVRAGWIGPTLILVFEDASGTGPLGDSFSILGPVQADTAVLLDRPGLQPVGWTQTRLRDADRLTFGSYGEGAAPTLVLPYSAGWQHTSPYPRHGTLALFGLCFQMDAGPHDTTPGLIRLIPAALYASKLGAQSLDEVADWFAGRMIDEIIRFADSTEGEAAALRRTRVAAFATSKEHSVIVLGSYADAEGDELARVRDYLSQKGYEATLIRDLPDLPMQSNAEKVRMWTSAARFCVMVDRTRLATFLSTKYSDSSGRFSRSYGREGTAQHS